MASLIDRYFCSADCDSCIGTTNECTTCRSPSQSPFFLEYQCLSACSSRHISSTQQCLKCGANCEKCSFSTSDDMYCLQCQESFYLSYGQCVPLCQSSLTQAQVCLANSNSLCQVQNCQNCEYGSSSRCGKCNLGRFRFHDGQCVSRCPRGFYSDSHQRACLPCASNCEECNSASNCLECSQLFLKRQSIGGECVGVNSAITIYESPYSQLSTQISNVIGFTEQLAFLQNLAAFALSHSFYKHSDITQMHHILELLLTQLPNSAQLLDQFALTFQAILSSIEEVHLDLMVKIQSLFAATLSKLHSLSLNTPQSSYFSMLSGLTAFDHIVALPTSSNDDSTYLFTGSSVIDIQPNSSQQVSLNAYALENAPSSSLKITNQGDQQSVALTRLIVLKQSSLLFQNDQSDRLMSKYGVSLRSSHQEQLLSQHTFAIESSPDVSSFIRCMTLDPGEKSLRYLPQCSTSNQGNSFKCTCSGEFALLVAGISFNAISPDQLKSVLSSSSTSYAGIKLSAELKMKAILNSLEIDSISESDRQFFLQHFIFQLQQVSDKQQSRSSLQSLIDTLLARDHLNDNEVFWALKAVDQYSNSNIPSEPSTSLLNRVKQLARIAPTDGVGIGNYQFTLIPITGQSSSIGQLDIEIPRSLSVSYPQAQRMVATLFKSRSLFQNTIVSDRYSLISSGVQLQLVDSVNRQIEVKGLNQPIVIQFQLESHPSQFQRTCVWWNESSGLDVEGCTSTYTHNRLKCECTHLTYFFAALDSQELLPPAANLFDLNLHLQGLCVSGGLILLGFVLAIIAECVDQRDKEQAQMMGDPRRKWTSPIIWFFPCLLYRRKSSTQGRKKAKGKQQAEYHSPKHRSSPSKDLKPSLFSFESQNTSEEEARQHLYPYSSKTSSFCRLLCYGFISSNALISPFYAFDPYASRAGRSSILFIKLLLALSASLAILHFLGDSMVMVVSGSLGLSLLFTPFSFYGQCFLKKARKGRADQYQAEHHLQDILPSVQDNNRQRDPGFAGAFEEESQQSMNKQRASLPMQIKCTMLTLLSILLGVLTLVCLGFIALVFYKQTESYELWISMNVTAIVIGAFVVGTLKTVVAACILSSKKDSCCWKCCKTVWVVTHVERVSLNMKTDN